MTDRRTISLPDLGDIETGLGLSEATRALIGPALFIPLHHDGLVMGALAVARTIGSHAFGTHEVGVVSLFADQAALALHTIHLRSELDRLGVLEDRERIARDLHDTVIQRLFATSMSLETTLSLVPSSVARKRIDEGIVELHDTIRSIRTTIFDLGRAEVGPITTGARQEILGVASDAARGLGFAPTVRFAGAVNAAVSDHVLDQLLPTLRELLSNVVRHARASAVDVAVIVAQDISLTVADDGIGLGRPGEERHRGLANITDRAVTLGGVTRIEHLEPGTQVTWRVPLPA
jgi:signal transduction histidine kinase